MTGCKSQTSAKLVLDCRLSSLALDAQKQVHLLQIVREAVLNAIKHADARRDCGQLRHHRGQGTHTVTIRDNGIGIGDASEPPGHYGLKISCANARDGSAGHYTFLSRHRVGHRSA